MKSSLLKVCLSAMFTAMVCSAPSGVRAESDTGVLVMAPSGSKAWMKTIRRAVKEAELQVPYRLFFGSGDSSAEVREIQTYVEQLEESGAHTIVAIPLNVSSYSPITRQWKYVLGVDIHPGFINNPLFPVSRHSTIHFMEPLNDSAVVVEILLDRAQEISRSPTKETLIIVAQGARDESDNEQWIRILKTLCARIKERAGYQSVEGFTLRDDSTSGIRQRATEALRSRVAAIGEAGGQPIVLILNLAPSGIEHKLGLELRGLNYSLTTKALLPDSRISEWIRSQVP